MSNDEYEDLWHYSERFSGNKLQRSELVTMAWKEGRRLGARCSNGLVKSMMHFRSKELNRRSTFPVGEVGKRTLDAWNHDLVYVDRTVPGDGSTTSLAGFLLPMRITPLDYAIVNDFMGSLTEDERIFLNDLTAGYNLKEISHRRCLDKSHLQLNISHFSLPLTPTGYTCGYLHGQI